MRLYERFVSQISTLNLRVTDIVYYFMIIEILE